MYQDLRLPPKAGQAALNKPMSCMDRETVARKTELVIHVSEYTHKLFDVEMTGEERWIAVDAIRDTQCGREA